MKLFCGALCALSAAVAMLQVPLGAAQSCESLTSLVLPHATISASQKVDPGKFMPPAATSAADDATGSGRAFETLPAFCRVAATLKPSNDSDIKIEVWLPLTGWNGKYQAVGNGAFNGSIAYPAMAGAMARGYATSSTDTGHVGNTAEFGLGHPEKVIDFGWRAVHEMSVAAKAIIAAHYDNGPRLSYWNGCSAGGRQALKAAQRFPADFDGIIAGAPGHDWTGRASQAVHVAQALARDEAGRLSAAEQQLVHRAAVEACDGNDGVKDGVIENPMACKFDPSVLLCKQAGDRSCLTPVQINTVKLLYAPIVNVSTRREIAGLQPGSELGWTNLGWTASARATGRDQFRFLVFNDPAWDVARFDAAADPARAEAADEGTINALDPNLRPFIARGGKMIHYHGWSDPQISPANSVQYYRQVMAVIGADEVRKSYRLFLAPGMGHCRGGEGPSSFDMLTALEQWVEQKTAPDRIVASHSTGGAVDRTRPLCPFPQVAVYNGTGDTNDAASFSCRVKN